MERLSVVIFFFSPCDLHRTPHSSICWVTYNDKPYICATTSVNGPTSCFTMATSSVAFTHLTNFLAEAIDTSCLLAAHLTSLEFQEGANVFALWPTYRWDKIRWAFIVPQWEYLQIHFGGSSGPLRVLCFLHLKKREKMLMLVSADCVRAMQEATARQHAPDSLAKNVGVLRWFGQTLGWRHANVFLLSLFVAVVPGSVACPVSGIIHILETK